MNHDTTRFGMYWTKAEICVSTTYDYADDAHREDVLTHEVGHLFGLADRYLHPSGACNPNDDTIMDGSVPGRGIVMGGLSRAMTEAALGRFGKRGFCRISRSSLLAPPQLKWDGLDNAWAEKSHTFWAAYRLSDQQDWVSYKSKTITDSVGCTRTWGSGCLIVSRTSWT